MNPCRHALPPLTPSVPWSTPHRRCQPPGLPDVRDGRPIESPSDPGARGYPAPPRAAALCRASARWHPPRSPHMRACPAAAARARPSLQSPAGARGPRGPAATPAARSRPLGLRRWGRAPPAGPRRRAPPPPPSPGPAGPRRPAPPPAARSRPLGLRRWGRALGRGRGLGLTAVFRHFVQEGHHAGRQLRRHPVELVYVLTLQVENILERLLAVARQHLDELRRQALVLGERHLGRLLFLRRQRREQRPFTAALQPLTTRVAGDLPPHQPRRAHPAT